MYRIHWIYFNQSFFSRCYGKTKGNKVSMIFNFLNGMLHFFFFILYESEYERQERMLMNYNNSPETSSFRRDEITNNFIISQLRRIKFEEQRNDKVLKREHSKFHIYLYH